MFLTAAAAYASGSIYVIGEFVRGAYGDTNRALFLIVSVRTHSVGTCSRGQSYTLGHGLAGSMDSAVRCDRNCHKP